MCVWGAICFTICLFHGKFVYSVRTWTICFTICLFISPDLDGYRAPRGITAQDNEVTKSRLVLKSHLSGITVIADLLSQVCDHHRLRNFLEEPRWWLA